MAISTNALRFAAIATGVLFHAAAQESVPPVYFFHTTIFLTPDTYEAFTGSPLLRDDFSLSRESTPVNGSGHISTAFYLVGMHTYLELSRADPSPSAQAPVGRIDVGMWIDHRSLLPTLRDRLELPEIKTRLNAQNQPAFDFLARDLSANKRVATWVSAVYPDGRTRDRPNYKPDRLFHDVFAYTITVNAEEREQLLKWFRAYAYKIREDGEKRIATGPEFTFTMLPEPAKGPRTASIEMTLNREKTGEQTYKLGDSELKFNKTRATLTFYFPQPDRH